MRTTPIRTTRLQCLPLLGAAAFLTAALVVPAQAGQTGATVRSPRASHVAHQAVAAPAFYECPICHERVTAAQAKRQHMLCACCHEKLVPVKTAEAGAKTAP